MYANWTRARALTWSGMQRQSQRQSGIWANGIINDRLGVQVGHLHSLINYAKGGMLLKWRMKALTVRALKATILENEAIGHCEEDCGRMISIPSKLIASVNIAMMCVH